MKTKNDILKRLKKLRTRYAYKYIKNTQARRYTNCIYNKEQVPLNHEDTTVEFEMMPCRVSSLVVIQDEETAHYCTYGSEDPEHWNGIICDKDEIAKHCKWFTPKVSVKKARTTFLDLLRDDKYVYDNYRDLAALQWTLGDRVHKHALSWWDRLVFWINSRLFQPKPPAALPPAEDIPEDLWDDPSENP